MDHQKNNGTQKLEEGKRARCVAQKQKKKYNGTSYSFAMRKYGMNNLISILTGFYCKTKAVPFINVSGQRSVLSGPSQTLKSLA